MGLPVYRGADFIGKALKCLQRQTYDNFEVIISVDGNDVETAEACRPFLVDPRFRMVVHPNRLDWVGNFNWLLQQDLREFFCYRQHDDTTAPQFFEVLLRVADKDPHAAAIYCDCQMIGDRSDIEKFPSIEGDPLDRMFQFISRLPRPPVPIRGLVRRAAIRQAGIVRPDEFRAAWQVFGWLANLVRWGSFRRVPEPLYYRLDHAHSYTREFFSGAAARSWPTLITGVLDAAMKVCRTPEERLFFKQTIFDRIVAYPPFREDDETNPPEQVVAQCLNRLKYEGNEGLLSAEELRSILERAQGRRDQIKRLERTRLGRGIFQIRQRYRFAQIAYPNSPTQRLIDQFCHLLVVLAKIPRLLIP